MYRYDLDARTWTRCADAPSVVQSPIMRCVGQRLYFIGGHDSRKGLGGKTGTVGEYDPRTDRWTIKTPMPTPREDMGSAVLDREIWIFGGIDNRGHTITSSVEVYDTATDTWTTRAEWTTPRCLGDFACSDGETIYLISGTCTMRGYPDLQASLRPQCYRRGLFAYLPTMPCGHCYTEVEILHGIIYVFGGAVTHWKKASDVVDRFDTASNQWLNPCRMPYAAAGVAACQHGGQLYLSGGFRDGQFLREFWAIRPD